LLTRSLAAGAIVLALSSLPAAADESGELGQLRQEAAALRQSLNRLDARIEALENRNHDQNPPLRQNAEAPAPSTPVAPSPVAAPAVPAPLAPAPVAPVPPEAAATVHPVVLLKRNWSQIERGTAQEKVQSLLGQPEKVLQIGGNTVWYYSYPAYPGIGRGSVFFNSDGKVSSSQSPTFGFGFGW
jgi:hypothetical protein